MSCGYIVETLSILMIINWYHSFPLQMAYFNLFFYFFKEKEGLMEIILCGNKHAAKCWVLILT